MNKTIAYIFGPDGAGKSTVTRELLRVVPNATSMNASRPDTWQVSTWHDEITEQGLDPNTLDPVFHIESMRRCYRAANVVLQLSGVDTVLIDSDLRAKAAVKAKAWYGYDVPLGDLYAQLCDVTNPEVPNNRQVGLHVTVGGTSITERATTLMSRIDARGETSFYDPTSTEDISSLLEAFEELEEVLKARQDQFARIETNRPYSLALVAGQLALETNTWGQ